MRVRIRARGAALACLAAVLISSPLPAEQITLRQAVEAAVSNNPSIAARRLSAEAASQSAKGAKTLTNPELTVAPSVIGDAGADSALFFSQPLEINGARRVRGEIASSEAAASGFEADAATRDIVLRVTRSYWDTAQARELVKLNEANLAYLETMRAAVRKQYDVGAVPGAQLLKMDVELARARQELAQARLALSQSAAELASVMNRPVDDRVEVSEALEFVEAPVDRGALLACALANRPEVAAARAQLAAARGRTRAASLRRAPDLAVQARKESFDRDSDGGVAIAITLPILDWGSARAEKRAAQASTKSQEKQLEAVRAAVALDVEQALQRMETASQVVREYQTGVLKDSEELAAMARKGYEKGANSYLEVLEAQRTLRSVKADYYSALAEHARAVAQLEWAAGCAVSPAQTSEVES